jgi:hypothetical protein
MKRQAFESVSEIDHPLWLLSQEVAVQACSVLVASDMTQASQMRWLSEDHGMENSATRAHLVARQCERGLNSLVKCERRRRGDLYSLPVALPSSTTAHPRLAPGSGKISPRRSPKPVGRSRPSLNSGAG